MNKNTIVAIIIVAIVFGGGGFYGGMKYAQGKKSAGNFSAATFQNMSPEQRQQAMQQFRASGGANGERRTVNNGQGGFISGDIIAKDDKSITVKMLDGSSKIVFYAGSTQINKPINGIPDDLETGKAVQVSGSQNSDGSITAQSISLRNQTVTAQPESSPEVK